MKIQRQENNLNFSIFYCESICESSGTILVTNIPRSTIWKIFSENKRHPYCIREVQSLNLSDYTYRANFCNWLLIKHDMNSRFVRSIMRIDECLFTKHGAINDPNDNHVLFVNYNTNSDFLYLRGVESK